MEGEEQVGDKVTETVTTTDEVKDNPDGSVTETETKTDTVQETPEFATQAEGSTSQPDAAPVPDPEPSAAPEVAGDATQDPAAVDDNAPQTD